MELEWAQFLQLFFKGSKGRWRVCHCFCFCCQSCLRGGDNHCHCTGCGGVYTARTQARTARVLWIGWRPAGCFFSLRHLLAGWIGVGLHRGTVSSGAWGLLAYLVLSSVVEPVVEVKSRTNRNKKKRGKKRCFWKHGFGGMAFCFLKAMQSGWGHGGAAFFLGLQH